MFPNYGRIAFGDDELRLVMHYFGAVEQWRNEPKHFGVQFLRGSEAIKPRPSGGSVPLPR